MSKAISAFTQVMKDHGLECTDPIVGDGQIRRFHVIGDRKGMANGWYYMHDDQWPNGEVGNWKSGERYKWEARCTRTLSTDERQKKKEHLE